MAYLLDANVFIAAKNLHYGFDFCPAFWEWLRGAYRTGKVYSIEKVADELAAGEDDLAQWAAKLPDDFFIGPDESVLPAFAQVSQWVNSHESYKPSAKNTFLQNADYYLVAQALAGSHTIVTHEKPNNSVHVVKIPSVAIAMHLLCISPFDMLRQERARFVLGTMG